MDVGARERLAGTYACAGYGAALFDSAGKFDSGSGWPSFWRTAGEGAVAVRRERDGRVECRCGACGGHLGHVFPDGPRVEPDDDAPVPEGDLALTSRGRRPRFCVNGLALGFAPRAGGGGEPEVDDGTRLDDQRLLRLRALRPRPRESASCDV